MANCNVNFSSSDLEALESAIKKGIKRVEYDDKTVEYRSLDEMLKIRDLMRKHLCSGDDKFAKRFRPNYSKGLNRC